jgi:hypothetical protein
MSFIHGAFGRARKALLISTACFAVLMGSVPSVFAVSANPNSFREVQPDGTAVATFESIGLYWSPAGGSADVTCTVRYRVAGTSTWREGLSLWFDERDDEYRGSLVHLRSGTPYEIELTLDPSGISASLQVSTWSDRFPIGQTVYLPEASSETLVIQNGGSANSGYTLYTHAPGASASIDVDGQSQHNVVIAASFVILRGLGLRNAQTDAVRLENNVSDVVIEGNDISGWGEIDTDGWGSNFHGAIANRSSSTSIARIVVQRNRMHHPRSDSNSWDEYRSKYDSFHPRGPQAVVLWNTLGNHVIRHNLVYSDDDHRFNDGFGAGSNYSFVGFPNRDSDIYGNSISHCWDDAIESEGANQNVRIWHNFVDHTFIGIAIAATSVGPLYIWRNTSARSRRGPFGTTDEDPHGVFLKAGGRTRNGTFYGGGRTYVLHNTTLQPPPEDPSQSRTLGMDQGIANSGGTILDMVSRNNIFHIIKDWHDSVCDDCTDASNDFDYDLYNGDMPQTSQANGIDDVPVYDPENAHGEFALDPSSPGFDAGVRLAGFNDGFVGVAPDMGAYEAGASVAIFSDGFTVYKDFSDNSSSSVSISLSCTSGTITNNPQNASEASPAVFNILDAAPGAVCQAIENPVPPGYTKDEWDCQQGHPLNEWCVIVNNANTANFLVGISYSDNSDALAKVELQCTNGNVNATHLYASPGNPAVFEVTGFSGDPDCASTEEVPDGYVADQSNCQGVPLLAVGECSMVNVAADQGSDMLFSGGFESR